MESNRHVRDNKQLSNQQHGSRSTDFVLEKVIFNNVFEKDIRRIYIYRKSERLAKAIHLIAPAFSNTPSLRNRLDTVAVGLIDAAILPPSSAREALSRELLALSSLLSVARTSALLSEMNADLITREVHTLLQEVAGYEEPRLALEEVPTLAEFSKQIPRNEHYVTTRSSIGSEEVISTSRPALSRVKDIPQDGETHKGQVDSGTGTSSRQQAILDVLKNRDSAYIKDISTIIRDVSEKTIQRELQTLVMQGKVQKNGERRWTHYFLAQH